MRTGLLNRAGDVRIPVEVNPATRQQRHARQKDRHRDGKWAPQLAATDVFSRARRTTDQRKSMALFGMFRRKAHTRGWCWRELQGRENTYGQKFGSSGRTRTYNPSVNSRTAYSRLTLQTQVLRRAKTGFSRKLGGLWGDSRIPNRTTRLGWPDFGGCYTLRRPPAAFERLMGVRISFGCLNPSACTASTSLTSARLQRLGPTLRTHIVTSYDSD
jgi:hypothetical protein